VLGHTADIASQISHTYSEDDFVLSCQCNVKKVDIASQISHTFSGDGVAKDEV